MTVTRAAKLGEFIEKTFPEICRATTNKATWAAIEVMFPTCPECDGSGGTCGRCKGTGQRP
jgi:hypothetical protein